MLGLLRNPEAEHDPRTIARDYYRSHLARGPAYNFSEYLSVALSAARSYAAGAAERADPSEPVVPPRGATTPTAFPGEVGYQYRVVVEVRENGVYVGSTAVNVTSANPLSATDVGTLAVEVAKGNLPGRETNPIGQALQSPTVETRTTVLTASRIQ